MKKILFICLLVLVLIVSACGTVNQKEEVKFPQSPITMIVPFAAGGASDILARTVLPYLEKEIGGSIVIVNKPGAGGEIGLGDLIAAKSDGYTIGMIPNDGIFILSIVKPNEFKLWGNVEILSFISEKNFSIVVNKDANLKTAEEFLAFAKDNPNKVSMGGVGLICKMWNSVIEESLGTKITPVNFNSGGEVFNALLGGHIIGGYLPGNTLKNAVSQNLIPLAVMNDKGLEDFPNIPTLKEKGVDLNGAISTGIAVPAGLPEDVKEKWINALTKLSKNTELAEKIKTTGEIYNFRVGVEFQNELKDEFELFEKIITKDIDKFVNN